MANSYIRNVHIYNADEAFHVRGSTFITVKDVHVLSTRKQGSSFMQAALLLLQC
jgi:hypothetical protein